MPEVKPIFLKNFRRFFFQLLVDADAVECAEEEDVVADAEDRVEEDVDAKLTSDF